MERTLRFLRSHFDHNAATASTNIVRPTVFVDTAQAAATTVSFAPRVVVGLIALFASLLMLANFAVLAADQMTDHASGPVQKLIKVFSVDYELNAPAFFSTLI